MKCVCVCVCVDVQVGSFGLMGSSSTLIIVMEQGTAVRRVVDPYVAQMWNRLDFLCLVSTFGTLLQVLNLSLDVGPNVMRGLELLRCLRPLRLVTRSTQMRQLGKHSQKSSLYRLLMQLDDSTEF
jgi:hypothetical protein